MGLSDRLKGPGRPGERVGPFTIVRELGRGGMGAVFEARAADGRPVALKLLLSAGRDDRAARRFDREVRALAGLEHPNIVRFVSASSMAPPWLAMELIAGRDLQRRLDALGRPSFEQTARLVSQVAEAMAYAHARGVVHRDLKPSNVLVRDQDLTAVITDFGLARTLEASRLTRTGDLLGTLTYMAPEQVHALREEGPPADVWAIGAILYRCITGAPPFTGDSAPGLVAAIIHGELEPPRAIAPDVPPDLEAVCLACLTRDPAARPTAHEVARALSARRPPTTRARRPRVAAVTTTALVALVGVAFAAARSRRTAPEPPAHLVAVTAPTSAPAGRPAPAAPATPVSPPVPPRYGALAEEPLRVIGVTGRPRWLHRGEVPGVAVTADGSTAITPEGDAAVVWDTRAGERLLRLQAGTDAAVWSVAVSPDGRRALAGDGRGEVHVWELPSGRLTGTVAATPSGGRRPLRGPGAGGPRGPELLSAAFAPDGSVVHTIDFFGRLRAIDPAGLTVLEVRDGPVGLQALAISPDGRTLALGSFLGALELWPAAGGGASRRLQRAEEGGNAVWSVAFSSDGRTLGAGYQDRTVRLWDVQRGAETGALRGHRGGVWGLAFVGAGRLLSASTDHRLILWDLVGGEAVRTLSGHTGWALDLSVAGGRGFSSSRDGTLRAWDLERGEEVTGNLHDGVVAAEPAGGGALLTLGREGVCSLRRPDGQVTRLGDAVRRAVRAADGSAVTGDARGTVTIWTLAPGAPCPTQVLQGAGVAVTALAVAPDARTVVWADAHGSVRRWSGGDPVAVDPILMEEGIVGVGLAREQLVLATSSRLTVTDGRGDFTGAQVRRLTCLALTAGGDRALTGHADGLVVSWTTRDLDAPRWRLDRQLPGRVVALAVSDEGRRAAAASAGGQVVLLELLDGRETAALDLSPAGDAPTSLSFDGPDRLLVGTELGVVLTVAIDGS